MIRTKITRPEMSGRAISRVAAANAPSSGTSYINCTTNASPDQAAQTQRVCDLFATAEQAKMAGDYARFCELRRAALLAQAEWTRQVERYADAQ